MHWLRTGLGQVDDRQTAMAEPDAPICFQNRCPRVWPPVPEFIPHGVEQACRIGLQLSREINEARYSTHAAIVDVTARYAMGNMGIDAELKANIP